MSDLVGNLEKRFSHDSYLIQCLYSVLGAILEKVLVFLADLFSSELVFQCHSKPLGASSELKKICLKTF